MPAARPGRLMVPFLSTNCLSTALGGCRGVRAPREAAALSPASSGKADKGRLYRGHHAAAAGPDPTSSAARSGGFLPLASAVASSSADSGSSTRRSSPCLARLSA